MEATRLGATSKRPAKTIPGIDLDSSPPPSIPHHTLSILSSLHHALGSFFYFLLHCLAISLTTGTMAISPQM